LGSSDGARPGPVGIDGLPAAPALLLRSFEAAVAAADPARILASHLPDASTIRRYRRTVVLGAGKAAASMALTLERHWPTDCPLAGTVITRYGHALPCSRIRVVEAGHPVPDETGQSAATQLLQIARESSAEDLLVVLLSGGGSSLLSLPVPGISMVDLRAVTQSLLASGAPIQAINIVRKHLSQITGGRLAAATRSRVLALVISDVVGDDLSSIASGPCAPDPSTYADALGIIDEYSVAAPASVLAWLRRGAAGGLDETPKPGDPLFERVEHRIVASAQRSLEAAASVFREAGVEARILSDSITGEARDVAQVHAAIARQIVHHGQPFPRPVALISGGECTVTVRGSGRGGRCSEFLLALALAASDLPNLWALAADTDGIDGVEEDAGAWFGPEPLARMAGQGVDGRQLLADNDAWHFFNAAGTLIRTGPTRTNVNDFRVLWIS
jgi:hydroxypyruvate reductase